jgi:hypothetical protein
MTKKKPRTKGGDDADAGAAAVDPREPVEPKPALLQTTLDACAAILASLEKPAEPQPGDLVAAVIHQVLGAGLPCWIPQEALRRFDLEFVDRNELRVTEAFETEELLADLGIPELFERCRSVQQLVSQIYGDQNRIELGALRTLSITERKGMFQRLPAIPSDAVAYLNQVLTFEDVLFAPRSAARSQAKLGLEGADGEAFVQKARELFGPYGHLPLLVGKHGNQGGEHVLCPSCLLARISAGRK